MVPDHDIIVIGAGIIGCAVGRELARRGAKVRIFEARTVGAGATRASAGVLAPWPRWALTAGSTLFVVVAVRILFIQPKLSNCVMGLGAVAWTGGNWLWTRGHEIPRVVLWWLTFLLLTITGGGSRESRRQIRARAGAR